MLFPEEDAPLLKAWIVKRIENTSDADSDVLADYVIALLKHDGDPASVRKLCEEEIPDFLTEEPKAFLDDVFQAITYRSYVPGAPPPPKQAPPSLPTPYESGSFSPTLPSKPNSRKRGYNDLDAPEGQDMFYQGGGRAMKQPRRGRRGRMEGMGWGGYVGGPPMPGMPPFDPNNPMEAMMQLQAMGLPYSGMQDYAPPGFRGGRNRGRRREKCPEFETKGFCSRGSTCTYDHGDESMYLPRMGGYEEYDPNDMPMSFPSPQNQLNPFAFFPEQGRGRGNRRRGRGGKKGGSRASFSAEGPVHDRSKSTIVIENIPEESFSEEAVRDFFSQFGTIVEVSMQPYKHLAIVKYDKWGPANAAYRSPKAIFDNRFVKVFWYKDDKGSMPPSTPSNGANGSMYNGHAEEDAGAEPEVDMEEFQRKQEEAQKLHQERETRKVELEQQRKEVEKKQQELLEKHREETEKLQAKLGEKTSSGPGSSSGTDMLKAKLALLEQEAKILGIDPNAADDASEYASSRGGYRGRPSFRGRGYVPRRRGGFRGHDGRHAAYAQYSIDNRPRKLTVTGADFTEPDKDEKLRHYLLNLGEFESVETGPTATHVSFPDRKAAEKFFYSLHGQELPGVDGKLDLAWVSTPLPPVAPAKTEPADEDMAGDDDDREEGEVPEREEEGQVSMEYELADDEAWG